jgi:hypothetical protein
MKRLPTVTWEIHKRVYDNEKGSSRWLVQDFGCSERHARNKFEDINHRHLAPVVLVKVTHHREVMAGMKFRKKGEA